ncbi:MAG: M50 family metallopeptidase [Chthoniobacterales bacterium]|nr:M50 family metallopeptidase [Chthoniobacterales bacterium]
MRSGSIRLFQVAGIEVFLHFSWFFVALYQLTSRPHGYASPIFAVYEYLALFLIVLLHEFGHAFACRQTGGIANLILLWPFGGVAFVQPPPRPAAQLWSIAAGPLVNVVLIPVFASLLYALLRSDLRFTMPDLSRLLMMTGYINIVILIFNLLPIYPLDGGQILRSLLWFPLGQIASLKIASIIGLIGGIAITLFAITTGSILYILLSLFLLSQAFAGWRHAKALQLEEEVVDVSGAPRPPVL